MTDIHQRKDDPLLVSQLSAFRCIKQRKFACLLLCLMFTAAIIGCQPSDSKTTDASMLDASLPDDSGDAERPCLFGRPTEATGIDDSMCGPSFELDNETFIAPIYSTEFINRLLAMTLIEPNLELSENPYEHPDNYPYDEKSVCAVMLEEQDETRYNLRTFNTVAEAQGAGGIVTHQGGCGKCSTLHNLAIYMKYDDMTAVVRQCAIENLSETTPDKQIACLMQLGFDLPCAQIWYYNSIHTRELCFYPCIEAIGKPYHNDDGSLNECLQCDEDDSGTVFKAVAGRTRRNSGLPSAICRPCSQIAPIIHQY